GYEHSTWRHFFPPCRMTSSSHYETSNVYLASFLLSQGVALDGFSYVSARRVQYRFIATEKLHQLLRVYWGNLPMALVPSMLFSSLQRLKSLVRRIPRASNDPPQPEALGQSGAEETMPAMTDFPTSPC